MDFREPADPIDNFQQAANTLQPADLPAPAAHNLPGSTALLVSVICGIAACVLNLFAVTLPLGVLFGVIGLVSGIIARIKGHASRSGLTLIFISMLIALIYLMSVLVPMLLDPTVRLIRG